MPNTLPDPWHFPRPKFADQIHNSLTGGLVNSITLVAPHRMGKTEFLLRDLLPAHILNGGDAVYANLWENKSSPEMVIIKALRAHVDNLKEPANRSGKVITRVDLTNAKFTAEYGEELLAKTPLESVTAAVRVWAEVLRAKNQCGIFAIDEIQYLATSEKFDDFTAALRTALEGSADCIKTVFASSSQTRLTKMFRDTKAAFYGSTSQITLQRLGDEFVTFIAEKAAETYKQTFAVEDIAHVFHQHNASPYFLRQALNFAALHRIDLKVASSHVGQELYFRLGLHEKLNTLNPLERFSLKLIHEKGQLNTAQLREMIATLTKERVTARRIQFAVAKLEKDEWIDEAFEGKYQIGDPVVTAHLMGLGNGER